MDIYQDIYVRIYTRISKEGNILGYLRICARISKEEYVLGYLSKDIYQDIKGGIYKNRGYMYIKNEMIHHVEIYYPISSKYIFNGTIT